MEIEIRLEISDAAQKFARNFRTKSKIEVWLKIGTKIEILLEIQKPARKSKSGSKFPNQLEKTLSEYSKSRKNCLSTKKCSDLRFCSRLNPAVTCGSFYDISVKKIFFDISPKFWTWLLDLWLSGQICRFNLTCLWLGWQNYANLILLICLFAYNGRKFRIEQILKFFAEWKIVNKINLDRPRRFAAWVKF